MRGLGGGGGGNMLCLTLPTFSLSYCKFLKGNPVEYLTCNFEAFNKTYISRVSLATLKPLVMI